MENKRSADTWWNSALIYHIHPISCFGAPEKNDFSSPAVHRILMLKEIADEILAAGCNTLYLGPVFESTSHGYDTVDYYHTDRRLGNNESLKETVAFLHGRGIRVILDGVFNHVGRNFWAFHDLRQKGEESPYRCWFKDVDFSRDNHYGDGFTYGNWEGHDNLVALNLKNPEVRDHIFSAVRWMIEELGIDGLRLDVAYMLDRDFMTELSSFSRSLRPNFFLLGEIIHGDYNGIVNEKMLDSATNYEACKGLWSSHNDRNYFEIAWSLDRQFGENGIYRALPLYSFADNHDINRAASQLNDRNHLYLLYTILYMMPGIPSLYYGSEWGIHGERTETSDRPLRPAWTEIGRDMNSLRMFIGRLASIRKNNPWLTTGEYRQLHVSNEEFVFLRRGGGKLIITGVNISEKERKPQAEFPEIKEWTLLEGSGGSLRESNSRRTREITIPADGFFIADCYPV